MRQVACAALLVLAAAPAIAPAQDVEPPGGDPSNGPLQCRCEQPSARGDDDPGLWLLALLAPLGFGLTPSGPEGTIALPGTPSTTVETPPAIPTPRTSVADAPRALPAAPPGAPVGAPPRSGRAARPLLPPGSDGAAPRPRPRGGPLPTTATALPSLAALGAALLATGTALMRRRRREEERRARHLRRAARLAAQREAAREITAAHARALSD